MPQKEPQQGQAGYRSGSRRTAAPGLDSAPPGPPPTPPGRPAAYLPPRITSSSRPGWKRHGLNPCSGRLRVACSSAANLTAPPQDRPKLAFEQVGPPPGLLRVPLQVRPRQTSHLDRRRGGGSITRGSGIGGPIVGDAGAFESPGVAKCCARTRRQAPGSAVQLLSDPQGVDFRPYLTRSWPRFKRNGCLSFPKAPVWATRTTIVPFSINRSGPGFRNS